MVLFFCVCLLLCLWCNDFSVNTANLSPTPSDYWVWRSFLLNFSWILDLGNYGFKYQGKGERFMDLKGVVTLWIWSYSQLDDLYCLIFVFLEPAQEDTMTNENNSIVGKLSYKTMDCQTVKTGMLNIARKYHHCPWILWLRTLNKVW